MKLFKLFVFAFLFTCLVAVPQFSFADDDVDDDTCATEPTDMTVNYGDYIICSIYPTGDSDTYRIWGNEGDRLSVEVVNLNSIQPHLLLMTPNGETLFSSYSGTSIEFNEILTETGKYTVKVSDIHDNETGKYSILFLCNGGSCLPGSGDYQDGYDQGYSDGQATCDDDVTCTQVITYGKVPDANCWVAFPTPCDVPNGWESTSEQPENMCGVVTTSDEDGYDVGFAAGIAAVKDNPSDYDLFDSCDDTTPVSDDGNCATFDLFTNTLRVPCLDMGEKYWLDMKYEDNHLIISDYGQGDAE